MSGYKLSLNSIRNINRTIVAVNQMRKTGVAGDLPFRQNQKRQPGGSGAAIQIGKTWSADGSAWTKGTYAFINIWQSDGAGGMEQVLNADNTFATFKAYNLFVDVEDDKFVACVGGWLVAAECEGE
jgi:hypothetical protein